MDAFKIRNEDEDGINHRGNEQREKYDLALRIGDAAKDQGEGRGHCRDDNGQRNEVADVGKEGIDKRLYGLTHRGPP